VDSLSSNRPETDQPDPKLAALEALLFVSGSPLKINRLAKVL